MREAKPGLVVYRTSGELDAIDEYSRRLVGALCAEGDPADYVADGLFLARAMASLPPWILLQYNPFSYGRWGIAPELVWDSIRLRHRTGTPLALMVHEAWVEMRGWRSTLMGAYQRVQLRSLLPLADLVMVTTQALVREIGEGTVYVPVGSNITPIAATSDDARDQLGFANRLVVALFGTGNPSRALEYAEAAIDALVKARGIHDITVLNLGAGAPALGVAPGTHIEKPGRLHAQDLSLRLRASDVILLPFTDGVSTRRGTLMAALAHGVPVLGLRGAATDGVLLEHPEALTLTPVGDPGAFARATIELTRDRDRLRAVGEAGRRLYAEQFDWPVVARRVAAAVDAVSLPRVPSTT